MCDTCDLLVNVGQGNNEQQTVKLFDLQTSMFINKTLKYYRFEIPVWNIKQILLFLNNKLLKNS